MTRSAETTIEGIERITEEKKKQTRTWRYRIKSPDSMQITFPIGQTTPAFELRREK